MQADAFEPEQWRDQLQGAVGVVSCLGGFGSNDFMLKACHLDSSSTLHLFRCLYAPRVSSVKIDSHVLLSVLSSSLHSTIEVLNALTASKIVQLWPPECADFIASVFYHSIHCLLEDALVPETHTPLTLQCHQKIYQPTHSLPYGALLPRSHTINFASIDKEQHAEQSSCHSYDVVSCRHACSLCNKSHQCAGHTQQLDACNNTQAQYRYTVKNLNLNTSTGCLYR